MRTNMLYEFYCNTCDTNTEIFFTSHKEYHIPNCVVCNKPLIRVFTAPSLRCNGIKKTPNGMVEMGNDYPSIPTVDRYAGVEKEMHEYINSNSDLEMSKLND
jgi:hypothetical protein